MDAPRDRLKRRCELNIRVCITIFLNNEENKYSHKILLSILSKNLSFNMGIVLRKLLI